VFFRPIYVFLFFHHLVFLPLHLSQKARRTTRASAFLMLPPVHDHFLPPDPEAFRALDPPTGRVLVIAPTRAACETIEIAFTLNIETYLSRTHGEKVRELARSGRGFGIIAGTGTGKTLAVRPIAQEILRAPLHVGVVNREREATPELPDQNVVIVTTGIARRWFQDGDISSRDTLVVDEIHQTSAELELCLALGKRAGCRFIWLSATVDPAFYARYLDSLEVLQVFSFDPDKAADVRVVKATPAEFLGQSFLGRVEQERRGVGVFLPTRAGVEGAAQDVSKRFPDVNVAFYHGGEPVRAIRPFLEGDGAPKPFLLTMTAAGQSALNVRGLDTVVIDDTRFSNVITGGRNVLTRAHLGSNEILQMAGRVHGRVANGRVFILSERAIDFASLRPTAPEFQLAGDSERVALTCADLSVRADELELPVPLDRSSYHRALANLQQRGLIEANGKLSRYGKTVEALPIDRAWAELLIQAERDLVPFLAVMSSIESLHRLTREEFDIDGLFVPGSDHLTTYNVYADAFGAAGFVGEIYGLPRHLFEGKAMEEWAGRRGVLVKAIEDAALASACILRALGISLPQEMPLADASIARRFRELLARVCPFDLVIDEQTSDGGEANVSRSSVCAPMGAVSGTLRFFADRNGQTRASIEGTALPFSLVRANAKETDGEFQFDPHRPANPLTLEKKVEYFGFVLESSSQPIQEFPPELIGKARRALAQSLARNEAPHRDARRNHAAVEELRELYKRSGGQTPRMGLAELVALYETQLNEANVCSVLDFRKANLSIRVEDFIPDDTREKLWLLPSRADVAGRSCELTYELEESQGAAPVAVARVHLKEDLARQLTARDLPSLDRPVRFLVTRGARGAIRADSLEELLRALDGPRPHIETAPRDAIPRRALAKNGSGSHPAIGRGKGGRSGSKRRGGR